MWRCRDRKFISHGVLAPHAPLRAAVTAYGLQRDRDRRATARVHPSRVRTGRAHRT